MTKLGSRQRRLLKKIDLALDKMDDGSYGICELTGEPIPVARLKARPVAQYTVEAKEELERRERGYRDRSDDDDVFGADDDGDE
jgi:DnaK suppressor protein